MWNVTRAQLQDLIFPLQDKIKTKECEYPPIYLHSPPKNYQHKRDDYYAVGSSADSKTPVKVRTRTKRTLASYYRSNPGSDIGYYQAFIFIDHANALEKTRPLCAASHLFLLYDTASSNNQRMSVNCRLSHANGARKREGRGVVFNYQTRTQKVNEPALCNLKSFT